MKKKLSIILTIAITISFIIGYSIGNIITKKNIITDNEPTAKELLDRINTIE